MEGGGRGEEAEVEEEEEGERGQREAEVAGEQAEVEGRVVEQARGVAAAVGGGEGAALTGGDAEDGRADRRRRLG